MNTCRSPSANTHTTQEETHGVQRKERLEVLAVHMGGGMLHRGGSVEQLWVRQDRAEGAGRW